MRKNNIDHMIAESEGHLLKREESIFITMLLFAGTSAGLVMPLFALFVEVLGASLFLIGIVVFGRESISVLSRMPVGGLSDRWGRKPILLLGTGSYTLSPLAFSLIHKPVYLIPFTMLHGLGIASIWTTAFAAVSDMTRAGKRGQAMGFFSIIPRAGFSIGTVLGGFLSKSGQYGFTYRVAFFLGLTAFLICLFAFKETHNRTESSISHVTEPQKGILTSLRLLTNPTLLLASIVGLAGSLTLAMSLIFFPIYAAQVGLKEDMIGLILVIESFLSAILAPLVGKLSDLIEKTLLLLSILLLSLLVVAIIPLMEYIWIFIVLFSLLGLEEAGIKVIPLILVAESDEVSRKGLGMGLVQTANHSGRAISPLLVSLLAGAPSLAYSFWTSSLIAGVLLVAMLPVARRIRTTHPSPEKPGYKE